MLGSRHASRQRAEQVLAVASQHVDDDLVVAGQHNAGAGAVRRHDRLAGHQGPAVLLLMGGRQALPEGHWMCPLLVCLALQPRPPVMLPGAVAVAVPRVRVHTVPVVAVCAVWVDAVPPAGHVFVGWKPQVRGPAPRPFSCASLACRSCGVWRGTLLLIHIVGFPLSHGSFHHVEVLLVHLQGRAAHHDAYKVLSPSHSNSTLCMSEEVHLQQPFLMAQGGDSQDPAGPHGFYSTNWPRV